MNNLSIIVPYRDREEHKKIFIHSIQDFFGKFEKDIDYKILFVEQTFEKFFNRGKLLNIGFKLFENSTEYFCFHDVDMIPVGESCDYSIPKDNPVHLANFVQQFGYSYQPEYNGGVNLFTKEQFKKVNGFYNNFWGWGAEDDDLKIRIFRNNLKIDKKMGRYLSLYHKPNNHIDGKPIPHTLVNKKIYDDLRENLSYNGSIDGLNTLEFSFNKIDQISDRVFICKCEI